MVAALTATAMIPTRLADLGFAGASLGFALLSLGPFLVDIRTADERRPLIQPIIIAAVCLASASLTYGWERALVMAPVAVAFWCVSDRVRQWTWRMPTLQFALKVGLIAGSVSLAEVLPLPLRLWLPAVAIATAVILEAAALVIAQP